ncbi:hypothetical protein FOMA001_g9785 [Fusarium oxysporum f. sp. matthiolae]|nr:hypothetical protein FOMA001_g9785 [Fusarium oxysporum f. sp. matthiolae]
MDLSPVSPSSSQPLEVSQPGRTVARRLTAPITIISICQTILQVAEIPEVGGYIGEALHQLTIMERTSIRSLSTKAIAKCSDLVYLGRPQGKIEPSPKPFKV